MATKVEIQQPSNTTNPSSYSMHMRFHAWCAEKGYPPHSFVRAYWKMTEINHYYKDDGITPISEEEFDMINDCFVAITAGKAISDKILTLALNYIHGINDKSSRESSENIDRVVFKTPEKIDSKDLKGVFCAKN